MPARQGKTRMLAAEKKRAGAPSLFADRKKYHPHVEQMVRINGLSTPDGLKDLTAIIECEAPPPAIMIPKIKSARKCN